MPEIAAILAASVILSIALMTSGVNYLQLFQEEVTKRLESAAFKRK
jgi:hypothetical protein